MKSIFYQAILNNLMKTLCKLLYGGIAIFNILQQRLSELDFWLLSYIQEQPSSLEEVLSALNTVVEDSTPLIPLLENTWVNWINAEVLYPKV